MIATSLILTLYGTCFASTFGAPNDRQSGGDARCVHRPVRSSDVGVAHRTLPCGSRLFVMNPRTRKLIYAIVIDRGPYGATLPNGTWTLKRYRRDPGKYRGCIDLTPGAARALGHNGFEPVDYWFVGDRGR